jgi:prepilin-type processing-associated H-X9-DG protein
MKLNLPRTNNAGLTRFETMVILLLLILLFAIILATLLPFETAARGNAERMNCVKNLKQLYLATQSWEENSATASGGISGLTGLNTGQKAWIDFAGYSNLLASVKILRCPAGPPGFNIRISYFLNLNAKESNPQMVLFGDDNFMIGLSVFGFSRPSDSLGVPGNADLPLRAGVWDVSANLPVAWDNRRHESYFEGNAAFADGSVSEFSSRGLIQAFQQSGLATNRLAIP